MGKSKIKPFIIAGIIILIICLIIGIYFYNTTDFLKSPKTLFTKYFSQTAETLNPKGLSTANNLEEYMKLNNYKEVGTTKFDFVNGLGSSDNNTAYVIKSELEKDVSNNKIKMPITLNYRNHELLSGTVLSSNDLYGINIDGLTERYVSVRNVNLKELADKLGIENSKNIPNSFKKIDTKNLNVTENLNNIFPKYIENFDNRFGKDLFSKEKDFKFTLESNEYISNRYILTTTVNDFYSFMKEQFTVMKTDDTLKNYLSDKFNVSNSLFESNLDSCIAKCDMILSENEGSNEFKVFVYESDGKLIKIEASTDNISYEFYVYNTDGFMKLFVNYNNIEKITRKTVETLKFTVENDYDDTLMDISVILTKKVKNDNKVEGNMAEYNEFDYRVMYGIHNVSETNADRTLTAIINNRRVLEYKSKITIGVNTEIDTINSENSDILNEMTDENLRNLVGTLTENAVGFIDVSDITIPEENTDSLVDTSTMDSATSDLNSAFLSLAANFNLEQHGEENLFNYLTQDRLVSSTNFGNELLLSNEKDIVLYRNKARQTFLFRINITDTEIKIIESSELKDVYEYTLNDILYPPQPEPEPEPELEPEPEEVPEDEDVPNDDLISLMKSEIDSYLSAVYNEALTTEEELVASDYINSDQLVNNCSTIYEAFVEEKEGGMFYVECKDEQGTMYSGVIQITEEGLKLLMFN